MGVCTFLSIFNIIFNIIGYLIYLTFTYMTVSDFLNNQYFYLICWNFNTNIWYMCMHVLSSDTICNLVHFLWFFPFIKLNLIFNVHHLNLYPFFISLLKFSSKHIFAQEIFPRIFPIFLNIKNQYFKKNILCLYFQTTVCFDACNNCKVNSRITFLTF